jgi:ABC-type transport system involved in cytochrome c biogenesis permease subunit
MPRARRSLVAAGVLVLLGVAVAVVGAARPGRAEAAPPPWPREAVDSAATIAVQAQGRVAPLYTWAGYTLLGFNHQRRAVDAWGRKLKPLDWLLDVVLRPEAADRTACFLVPDDQVLAAVGMTPEGKKRRDRYSYRDLAPVRAEISRQARAHAHKEAVERTLVETYLVELSHDLLLYERLRGFLRFATEEIGVPADLRPALGGRERATMLDLAAVPREVGALLQRGAEHAHAAEGEAPAPDSVQAAESRRLAGAMLDVLDDASALHLLPPLEPSETEWSSPGDVLATAIRSGTPVPEPHAAILRALADMGRSADDPARLAEAVERVRSGGERLADARGEYGKIRLEVALLRWAPFHWSLGFYVLAFLGVAALWFAPRSRWLARIPWALLLVGLAIHVAGIVVRCILRERPPVSTLYETALFITAAAVAASLVIEWIGRQRIALSVAPVLGALGLFVANRYEILKGEDTFPKLVAVLDTNFWLSVHVTCITLGYAGGLLASALAHVTVLGRWTGLKRQDEGFYRTVGRMTYGALCFALLFSVVGTILGGIWANESWGRFWGWDPKENGALMIVLSQLAILHARMGGLLKTFGIALAAIGSGIIVAFSWWGVNLLGIGLHSYGFTTGIDTALKLFYGVEGAVILAGFVWWLAHRGPAGATPPPTGTAGASSAPRP